MTDTYQSLIDSDLIIVSNRQPYRHSFADASDEICVDQPSGGVVAGLDAVARDVGGTWIAWGDGDADQSVSDATGRILVPRETKCYTLRRVWLSDAAVEGYYEGYANRVLWPLCHTATGAIAYDPVDWEYYQSVNASFAREILAERSEDSIIWFHDYHLALAPSIVRKEHDGVLAHFWHIPWPTKDVFRICPQRKEILAGLLSNDIIGFHIDQYCEHFLTCVEAFVPEATVHRATNTVVYNGRVVTVDSFPLGVDVGEIRQQAGQSTDIYRRVREQYDVAGQLVLGVDRLDYSKGIPERLASIEYLLEHQPSYHESFTYIQKGITSRENIPEYQTLHEEIDQWIDRINTKFGTHAWRPVVSIREYLPDAELYGLYRAADVMLVSALRDGMNLVAQEYVASQLERDGVLVLSEFAGSHEFLGEGALSVNPFDTAEQADAIAEAISMDAIERNQRMQTLEEAVTNLDIQDWVTSVLESTSIDRTSPYQPSPRASE